LKGSFMRVKVMIEASSEKPVFEEKCHMGEGNNIWVLPEYDVKNGLSSVFLGQRNEVCHLGQGSYMICVMQ
jgi:hypothetical protein